MGHRWQTIDPIELARILWPDTYFYSQQRDIIYSVWNNKKTVVPASHMMGKDFAAGAICPLFFVTRHPCRIVTTSVDSAQLEGVLWGEMRRFIQTSKVPLEASRGGPLLINHMHIRMVIDGEVDGLSYLIGRVAAQGEGMAGHHIARTGDGIPRTLFLADEASGIDALTFEKASEWAERELYIGNCYECDNAFKWAVKGRPGSDDKGGDILHPSGTHYIRKIHRITAEQSPNVRLALAQKAKGLEPTGEILIPGVLPWEEYLHRRATWDHVKQCVGLDADWYEGSELRLFPSEWLNRAESLADRLKGKRRTAKAIGIDPAEGGDSTSMSVVDERGLIEQVSTKTPDTSVIRREALAFMRKHHVPAHMVAFDRGGGGKQIADDMRADGYAVRTVAFGEAPTLELKGGRTGLEERKDNREERTAVVNRRAEMYLNLSVLLDPSREGEGFAIPSEYVKLRHQLSVIPKLYDREGRLRMLPKNKASAASNEPCLISLIGHSPDESDSLVLAVFALQNPHTRAKAGAF